MTCRKHQSQLSAYLDDRLEPEARAALEADLSSCPECRQTLHLMSRAGQILASQPAAAPPPGLAARATRHALAGESRTRSPGFLDGWLRVAWPTAALATVATVLLLFFARPAPTPSYSVDSSDPLGILVGDAPVDPVPGEVLALEVTP